MAGTPDIEILVGVLGGGKISGASGVKIKNQLTNIMGSINKSGVAQLKIQVDQKYLESQIKQALKNVKLPTVSGGSSSGSAVAGGNGAGSSVKQTANGLREIISLTKQINQARISVVGKAGTDEGLVVGEKIKELAQQRLSLAQAYSSISDKNVRAIMDEARASEEASALIEKFNIKLARTNRTAELSYSKLEARVRQYYDRVSSTISRDPDTLKNLEDLIERIHSQKGYVGDLATEFSTLQATIRKNNLEVETFTQKIGRVISEKFGYAVLAAAAAAARRALSQIYTNVVDIDTAMTELKKVTDETASTYHKFLNDAAVDAKALGATLSDKITATADFARLGYSLTDASTLSDAAIIYKNVGDGITSISDASESVISTMQAFGIAASESMSIVDKFNEVGNKFAISSKGVGDALLRSASSLASANNDLDESIALVTAANSVVQDPDKVGTALKTVSMYLRAAKTEAEEAGESTEGMAESVSKLRQELLSLTGGKVDIMADDSTFKSTYQIMKELSAVWGDLTDITQANILEQIGGKRNSNVVSALLQNFDVAERALATSQAAAGSALAENEKYLDSINGKIAQMQASYQKLSANLLDSGWVKGIISIGTVIIDFLNKVDDMTHGFASTFISMAVVVTGVAATIQAASEKLAPLLGTKAINSFTALKGFLPKLIEKFKLFNQTISQTGLTMNGLQSALTATIGKLGLWALAIGAIVAVGYSVYRAYRKANPTLEEMQEKMKGLENELSSLNAELETNKSRLKELQDLADHGTLSLVEQDELNRLREQNQLLEAQIQYREVLAQQTNTSIQWKSLKEYQDFTSSGMAYTMEDGTVVAEQSDEEALRSQIAMQKTYNDQLKSIMRERADIIKSDPQLSDERNQERLDELAAKETAVRKKMEKNEQYITNGMEKLENLVSTFSYTYGQDLTPYQQTMNEALDLFYNLQDAIVLSSADGTALTTVMNRIVQSAKFKPAVDELNRLASAGELTKDSLVDLYKTNPLIQSLLNSLAEIGGISLGNLDTFIDWFTNGELQNGIATATSSVDDFLDSLSLLSDKYDLISQAQEDLSSNGVVTLDTLKSIAEKYGDVGEKQVELYLNGAISGKEMVANLNAAYQDDIDNVASAQAAKLMISQEYYSNLSKEQKASIESLASLYEADLANCKNLEEAKLRIRNAALEEWMRNYGRAIHSAIPSESLLLTLAYEDTATTPEQKARQQAAKDMLAELKRQETLFESFTLDSVDLSKYIKSSSPSSSSSSTDKWKEAAEAEIAALKHRLEMDQITQSQYYDGLEAIENKYYKNSVANQKKYAEEIRSLDEELFNGRRELFTDWVNDQNKQAEKLSIVGDVQGQRQVYEAILKETEKMIDSAHKYGLDENSDYLQELQDQYHQTCQAILSMVTDAYDRFISYADDFDMWSDFDFTKLDVLEQQLARIQELYLDGTLGWTEYVDAYNEVAKKLYDTKQDSIETIIDLTMEMIQQEAEDAVDALDEQIDRLSEIIALKKKLLQDSSDEADHERQVADAVAEIAKLRSKIAQLALDDSRDAYAQRVQLEEQLAEKQRELADLQGDYTLDKTLDTLDEAQEAKEKEAEAEKDAIESSVDTWVKRYQLAIDRIDNDWDGLYRDLNKYMAEFRDSIDGPDSLETAWSNVNQMIQETGKNIEAIYNSNHEVGINPEDSSNKEAQKILDQMQANSIKAKENGSSIVGEQNLHKANQELALQYEQLTGRKLTYNNGWRFANGSLAYDISSAAVKNPSGGSQDSGSKWADKNPYTAPSASDTIKMNSTGDKVKWVQYQLQKTTESSLPITGQFWTSTESAVKKFQKQNSLTADGIVGRKTIEALKKYHTGGIVDGTGAINDQEVLAILRRGEMVLNDGQKKNLRAVLNSMASVATMTAGMKNLLSMNKQKIADTSAVTYAPNLSVTINHQGKLTDADADRYGKKIGNVALETMYETMRTRGIKG